MFEDISLGQVYLALIAIGIVLFLIVLYVALRLEYILKKQFEKHIDMEEKQLDVSKKQHSRKPTLFLYIVVFIIGGVIGFVISYYIWSIVED